MTSSMIRSRVKLERLHALLDPSKPVQALAVVVQAEALRESSVLRAVVLLTLVTLGGAEGDGRVHVALLELPVLHTVRRLVAEHQGVAAVAGEAPAHEALAVSLATAIAEKNCVYNSLLNS